MTHHAYFLGVEALKEAAEKLKAEINEEVGDATLCNLVPVQVYYRKNRR